jgi:hypothetical protein
MLSEEINTTLFYLLYLYTKFEIDFDTSIYNLVAQPCLKVSLHMALDSFKSHKYKLIFTEIPMTSVLINPVFL